MIKVFGVTNYEKTIVTFTNDKNNQHVVLYDGKDEMVVLYDDFRKDKQNYYQSKFKYIKCYIQMTLQETWTEFVNSAKLLKQETKGFINLFKSGDYAQTALHLFNEFSKKNPSFYIPDKIEPDEVEWLLGANFGALTYVEKYVGAGYKYDIISMYPAIMKYKYMLFPMKRGRFEIVKSLSKKGFNGVSIWRCKINKSEDNNINKLFKYNSRNYYTNMDIIRAEKLNLKIELIEDGNPNVLIYEQKKCITGEKLFKDYVDYLYDLKQKKIPGSIRSRNDSV